MKKALITGITGQDGSYLTALLLEKGYEVHGIVRRVSYFNRERIDRISGDVHNQARIFLHYGDLKDSSSLFDIMKKVKPDEVYHLAAQSHVRVSFDVPLDTADVTAVGALRLLDAIRMTDTPAKFYQASSSEMYGKVLESPQRESTPFYPRSPYGISKVFAYWTTVNYREGYGMYAANGILFNHESPRRGENFVTRKVTLGLAKVITGKADRLYMGNLDASRDWGYAPEFVEAMWRILQHERPEDFVIATNETHTVREFIEEACRLVGIEVVWVGKGEKEKGIDRNTGNVIIEIDPRYYRPAEVEVLLGDYSKAKKLLSWSPKTSFKDLVKIMLAADLELMGVKDFTSLPLLQ